MVLDSFIFSIGLTLLFSSMAAVFYYQTFAKQGIALSIVLYSLLVFNIVYFVSFEDNIGLGIGLLGILSLIRLRTAVNNLIDIAFIFYAITLGLLNASIAEQQELLAGLNIFLTAMICLLSSSLLFKRKRVSTKVTFDDLDLADLHQHQLLVERVHQKLKIDPLEIEVVEVDYLKDAVTLKVTYESH